MPISSSLLYGEMAASGFINVAFAIFGGFLVSTLAQMIEMTEVVRSLILLAFVVGLSTAIQYGLFVALQANSCGKVTNYGAIAKATGQGALITAIMVAIPLFVEPMRLVVSEALAQFGIGGGHQVPLTPALEVQQTAIIDAAHKIASVQGGGRWTRPVVGQRGRGVESKRTNPKPHPHLLLIQFLCDGGRLCPNLN